MAPLGIRKLKQMNISYIIIGISLFSTSTIASNRTIHIYQDADLSHHIESSDAIQKGIEVAFAEIGNNINGFDVVYKYLDHRGNVIRSKQNYQKFIDDPNALAIYSGIHSPPLIRNRDYINENEALTMVPWAAGGSITRYPLADNWIFRLSIDDTQAAPVIIGFALKEKGCSTPHLLLEETPWGDSNLKSMGAVLHKNNISSPAITRFSWNIKNRGARKIVREIVENGDDCMILVANATEGAIIVQEMANLPAESRIPIISHWGITGGSFPEVVTATDRDALDLHFIQTCFSFTNKEQSILSKKVFSQLKKHTNRVIKHPNDLKAAVGFVHAYDLTKLLIESIRQTGLTGDMSKDRQAIRLALENLETPVQGLVKTYHKPFSAYNKHTNYNGHEALHDDNYCMGQYGANNEIMISPN